MGKEDGVLDQVGSVIVGSAGTGPALAIAPEGMTRTEAARLTGMERQALRRHCTADRAALRQALSSGKLEQGAATDGVLPAEGTAGSPELRSEGAGSVGKEGAAERAEGNCGGASGQADRAVFSGRSLDGAEGPRVPSLVAAWPAAAGAARQPVQVCLHLRRRRTTTGNDLCLVLPFVSTAAVSVFLRDFSEQLALDLHAVRVPTAPADMSPLYCTCRTTSPW